MLPEDFHLGALYFRTPATPKRAVMEAAARRGTTATLRGQGSVFCGDDGYYALSLDFT